MEKIEEKLNELQKEHFPKHEGDGKYWYIDIHHEEIKEWWEEGLRPQIKDLVNQACSDTLDEFVGFCEGEVPEKRLRLEHYRLIKLIVEKFKEERGLTEFKKERGLKE